MLKIEQISSWAPATAPAGWTEVTSQEDGARGVRSYHSAGGSILLILLERQERRVWLHLRLTGPMQTRPTRELANQVVRDFVRPQDTERRLSPLNLRTIRGSAAVSILFRIREGR